MIMKPSDVEVAAALLELVQEALDSMNGVQELEPLYKYQLVSSKSSNTRQVGVPCKSTLALVIQ